MEDKERVHWAAQTILSSRLPSALAALLGKWAGSIGGWKRHRKHGVQADMAPEELEACLSGRGNPADAFLQEELRKSMGAFLRELPLQEQKAFICRYWYLDTTQEIAKRFGWSQRKVKSTLYRIRKKWRTKTVKLT